jgi:malonate-semialdehyde dehydrogenase (acetylating) / methylmalonate-semialdehyde dehydrogenase
MKDNRFGKINNYIGGEFVESGSSYIDITSPLDGTRIGTVPISGVFDLNEAVKAAKKALPEWSGRTAKSRSEVLYNYRQLLRENRDSLAEINHVENGKSMAEAYAGVDKAIELTEFACSIPQLVSGRNQEVSRGVTCRTERIPVGITAAVTPFNFPLMVPHWSVPNSIALGNAMILKPSESTPVSASRMAELWKKAGLPDGIFSVVNGSREIVEALCDHPEIEAVSFVGSTAVAKSVYRRSAMSLKRVLALGGAKNHLLVFPDAHPDMAAHDILASATGMSGQRCMAASVMVCVGDVEHIVRKICEEARDMVPGKDLPPIISPQSIEKLRDYLAEAEEGGAEILVDGRTFSPEAGYKGYAFGPSIIDYRNGGRMSDEEVFGPVLEILKADNLANAVRIENFSPYGNAASVFTQSGRTASEAVNGLSAGMCGINIGVPVPREPFSFGGWNSSKFGAGDLTGEPSIEFWTKMKKITAKWNPEDKQDWMS